MDGKLYFEQDPWEKAVACIGPGGPGDVVEISVHCTCAGGAARQTAEQWRQRLQKLLDPPVSEDELWAEGVWSCLQRYASGAIVRIFIDDSGRGVCENFEIVTKKALLVWKPDVHPQGRMLGEGTALVECTQPYAVQLEVTP